MKKLILWMGLSLEGEDDLDEDGEIVVPDWVCDGDDENI